MRTEFNVNGIVVNDEVNNQCDLGRHFLNISAIDNTFTTLVTQ